MADIKNLNNDSVRFENGSALVPSISFASDPNTGIYTGGSADTLFFGVGGSQKVRFDSNGVGVSAGNVYIATGYRMNFDYGVSNNYYLQKSSTTMYMHSPVNLSLQTDGNHRLYINQAGNVGIGTTSPDAPLTVHSSTDPEIRFGYSSTQDHRIVWDSSKVYIYADPENANGSSAIGLGVDGTLGLFMDDEHDVGIGTTSPNTRLHVADSTTGVIMRIQNSSAGEESSLRFQALSSTSTQEYADIALDPQAGSGALVFRNPYTSERMRIDVDGNVGIGTTSPAYKLQVSGDVYSEKAFRLNKRIHYNFNGATFDGENTDGEGRRYTIGRVYYSKNHWGYYGTLRIQVNTRYPYNGTQTFLVQHSGNFAGIRCIEAHGSSSYLSNVKVELGAETDTGVDYSNYDIVYKDIYLYVDRYLQARVYAEVDAHAFDYDKTTITSGEYYMTTLFTTTANQSKTSVTGFSNYQTVELVSNDNNKAYIAGNLGIGTASPERKLHVFNAESGGGAANANSTIVLENNTHTYVQFLTPTTAESGLLFGDTDNDAGAFVYKHSTNSLHFRTNAVSDRMVINSSGNVGIGTTSPSDGLTVATSLRAYGAITPSANGAYLGRYDAGVNIDAGELVLATNGKTGWDEDVDEFGRIRFYSTDGSGIGARDAAVIKAINGFGDGSTTTTFSGELAFFTSAYNANVAEALRIDGSGNVGIGTTSPGAKLDVTGVTSTTQPTMKIQSGTSNVYGMMTTYDAYHGFVMRGTPAAATTYGVNAGDQMSFFEYGGQFRFYEKNNTGSGVLNEIVRLDKSNSFFDSNVGIGTTSPDAPLHVQGDGSGILELTRNSGTPHIFFKNTANTGYGRIYISDDLFQISSGTSTKTLDFAWIEGDSNGNISFPQYGAGLLKTDANGNVSVDTTSYGSMDVWYLHGDTAGDQVSVDDQRVVSFPGATVAGQGTALNPFTVTIPTFSGDYDDLTNKPTLGTAASSAATDFVAVTGDTMTGNLTISPSSGDAQLTLSAAVNAVLNINAVGASYVEKDTGTSLTLANNVNDQNIYLRTKTGGATTNVVTVTGTTKRVGIGTTSPLTPLHVSGSTFIDSGFLYMSDALPIVWGAGNVGVEGNSATKTLQLRANGQVRLHIASDGNVGLGSTNPQAKLHVNGSVRIDDIGTTPNLVPSGPPAVAIGTKDPSKFMAEPDQWLKINIAGVDYVIPAYFPA